MKTAATEEQDEMRVEYDLKHGRPHAYAERMRRGSNLVLIEPDLSERFPSSEAVNQALRLIVQASAKAVKTRAAKQAQAS